MSLRSHLVVLAQQLRVLLSRTDADHGTTGGRPGPLDAEFEDPYEAILEAHLLFGGTEESILTANDEPRGETPREVIRDFYELGYGSRDDPDAAVWPHAADIATHLMPARFHTARDQWLDGTAWAVGQALAHYGHSLSAEWLSGDVPSRDVKREHLPVLALDFGLADEPEPRRVHFRPPPAGTEVLSVLNHAALFAALDDLVLGDRGLEVVRLAQGEWAFAVFESDRLDDLESEYGEGVPLFGNPLVVRRDFHELARNSYDPDNVLDHEAEFGVPEPDDTFRLETQWSSG